MKAIKPYDIIKVHNSKAQAIQDEVIVEYHLCIFLNGKEFITLPCTPKALKSLVVGFLYSEGIIKSKGEIKTITIDEEKGKAYVEIVRNSMTILNHEMDRLNKIKARIPIKLSKVLALSNVFSKKSKLFIKTGGVHSCALCTQNEIIVFEEDIGRHSALDKILGKALLENINLEDKIILITGRVSSEIMTKVAKGKIPVLISRSAPTNIAINMARDLGITLIGFAREQKMNVYTNMSDINNEIFYIKN